MVLGKDARTLRPTLYDFLLQRAIDIQADDTYYQTWLQFRKTQVNPKAETLVALDYLQYQYRKGEKTRSTYKQSLDSLLTHTTDPESQLEIQLNRLDWLQQEPYYYQNNAQQDLLLIRGLMSSRMLSNGWNRPLSLSSIRIRFIREKNKNSKSAISM